MVILYRRLLPKTNVPTLAELLAGFGSKFGELTTAVFVIDAGIGGIDTRTVKLTVAVAPMAMFPKLQVTVPPIAGGGAVQEAPPEFIDRNIACAGTGSTKVVVTRRSDLFCTVMIADPADPELLPVFGSAVLEVTDGVFTRVVPSATEALNVA